MAKDFSSLLKEQDSAGGEADAEREALLAKAKELHIKLNSAAEGPRIAQAVNEERHNMLLQQAKDMQAQLAASAESQNIVQAINEERRKSLLQQAKEMQAALAARDVTQYNDMQGWEKPAFVASVAGGATQGAATPAAREAAPYSPAETRMVNPAYNSDLDFMRSLESLKPFAVTQSQSAWQAEDAAAEQRLRDVASMEMRNYFENELGSSQLLGGGVAATNRTIQAIQGLLGEGVSPSDAAYSNALDTIMKQAEPGILGSVKRGLGGMASDTLLMASGGKLAGLLGRAKTGLQAMLQVGVAVQPLALRGAINTWQETGKVSDTLADWTIETVVPALFGGKDAWGYFINGAGRAVKPAQLASAILATGAWGGTDEGATELAHIIYEASTGKTDPDWKSRLAAAALTGFIAESGIAGVHEVSAVPGNIAAREAQGKYVAGQERAAEQAGVISQQYEQRKRETRQGAEIAKYQSELSDEQTLHDQEFLHRHETKLNLDQNAVRSRASQIYEQRMAEGRKGSAETDWTEAESQLVDEALYGQAVPTLPVATAAPASAPSAKTNATAQALQAENAWTQERNDILAEAAKANGDMYERRPYGFMWKRPDGSTTLVRTATDAVMRSAALGEGLKGDAKQRARANVWSSMAGDAKYVIVQKPDGTTARVARDSFMRNPSPYLDAIAANGITITNPDGGATGLDYDSVVYINGETMTVRPGETRQQAVERTRKVLSHEQAHIAVNAQLTDADASVLGQWMNDEGIYSGKADVRDAAFGEAVVQGLLQPYLNGELKVKSDEPVKLTLLQRLANWARDLLHMSKRAGLDKQANVRQSTKDASLRILEKIKNGSVWSGKSLIPTRFSPQQDYVAPKMAAQAKASAANAATLASVEAKSIGAEAKLSEAKAKAEAKSMANEARLSKAEEQAKRSSMQERGKTERATAEEMRKAGVLLGKLERSEAATQGKAGRLAASEKAKAESNQIKNEALLKAAGLRSRAKVERAEVVSGRSEAETALENLAVGLGRLATSNATGIDKGRQSLAIEVAKALQDADADTKHTAANLIIGMLRGRPAFRQALENRLRYVANTKGNVGPQFSVTTYNSANPEVALMVESLRSLPREERIGAMEQADAVDQAQVIMEEMNSAEDFNTIIDELESIVEEGRGFNLVEIALSHMLQADLTSQLEMSSEGVAKDALRAKLARVLKASMDAASSAGSNLKGLDTLGEHERATPENIEQQLFAMLSKPSREMQRAWRRDKASQDTMLTDRKELYMKRRERLAEVLRKNGINEVMLSDPSSFVDPQFMAVLNRAAHAVRGTTIAEKIMAFQELTPSRQLGLRTAAKISQAGLAASAWNGLADMFGKLVTLHPVQASRSARANLAALAHIGLGLLPMKHTLGGVTHNSVWWHMAENWQTQMDSVIKHYTGIQEGATGINEEFRRPEDVLFPNEKNSTLRALATIGYRFAGIGDILGEYAEAGRLLALGSEATKSPELFARQLENIGAKRRGSKFTWSGQNMERLRVALASAPGPAQAFVLRGGLGLFQYFTGRVRGAEQVLRAAPLSSIAFMLRDVAVLNDLISKQNAEPSEELSDEIAARRIQRGMQAHSAILANLIAPMLLYALFDKEDLDDLAKGVIPQGYPGAGSDISNIPFIGSLWRLAAAAVKLWHDPDAQGVDTFQQEYGKVAIEEALGFIDGIVSLKENAARPSRYAEGTSQVKWFMEAYKALNEQDFNRKMTMLLDSAVITRDAMILADTIPGMFGGGAGILDSINKLHQEQKRSTYPGTAGYFAGLSQRSKDFSASKAGTTVTLSQAQQNERDRTVRNWGNGAYTSQLNDYWESNFALHRQPRTREARAIVAKQEAAQALKTYLGVTGMPNRSDMANVPPSKEARAWKLWDAYKNAERNEKDELADYNDAIQSFKEK